MIIRAGSMDIMPGTMHIPISTSLQMAERYSSTIPVVVMLRGMGKQTTLTMYSGILQEWMHI